MRDTENAVLGALLRAQRFLDEDSAVLSGVDFTTARKRLDTIVTSFSDHALDQNVGDRNAKGETAKQRQLRLKLRGQQMEPIAIIARHNLRSAPEFKAMTMPKRKVVGPAFIASAKGMAHAATIHKDTLIEEGLPATFLDDLEAGIAKLELSMSEREKNRTQRVGATKGLAVERKNGQTILGVLDALVQQALDSDNEAVMRKWQSVRLVRRTTANTGTTSATASQATPETTSQPTSPAAALTPAGVTIPALTLHPVSESTPAA